jgi:hypothetical protein
MTRSVPDAPALAAGDPRLREDGLGWVTRAVFADERLRVTVGRGRAGAAGWAVVPTVERARFLVPLGNRRVAAASMLAYNALRAGPTRAVRAVIGGLARAGAVQAMPFPVLSVSAPAGVAGTLLVEHLAAVLGEPALVAAIGVRPPDPTRKPTLQLFDAHGRPRGYAKIGWNGATRSLVRAESAALRSLPADPGGDYPLTPHPLHAGEWGDRVVAVTAPLPESVRRLPDPDRPRLAAMLAIARRGGPPGDRRPLAGSPFLARLRRETESVPGDEGVAVRAAVGGLAARAGDTELEFGDWHGDWVPWNLGAVSGGTSRGRLVAWDWEHSGSGVPVGFDLAHQAFNTALVVGGQPADRAAEAAGAALRRHGAELGVAPGAAEVVLDAYLVEMWLRTFRMAVGGAGWNGDLHPGLLEVLARRMV